MCRIPTSIDLVWVLAIYACKLYQTFLREGVREVMIFESFECVRSALMYEMMGSSKRRTVPAGISRAAKRPRPLPSTSLTTMVEGSVSG